MELKTIFSLNFVAFVIKGICALALNIIVANYLDTPEFVEWSIFFSLVMLLSISDLGIGQYVLTSLMQIKVGSKSGIVLISESIAALTSISLFTFLGILCFLYVVDRLNIYYVVLVAILLIRIPITPYSAYLQSIDKLHEKKLIESLGYFMAVSAIFFSTYLDASLYEILMLFVAIISLNQFLIIIRASHWRCPKLDIKFFIVKASIFKGASPFLASNSANLLIYGAFISLSSLVLTDGALALLAIMHATILTYGYQACELIFRILQVRFLNQDFRAKIRYYFLCSCLVGFIFIALAGAYLFELAYPKYLFSMTNILLFSVFSLFEFYYLLLTFHIQIDFKLSPYLTILSVTKVTFFILALIAYFLFQMAELNFYLILLSISSIVSILCATFVTRLEKR